MRNPLELRDELRNDNEDEKDPFGRIPPERKPEPEHALRDLRNPETISAPVGDQGKNQRKDVAKTEVLLSKSGDLDLKKTDGPTGYWGLRTSEATRGFQKRNGLKVDGQINPGGETIGKLADLAAGAIRALVSTPTADPGSDDTPVPDDPGQDDPEEPREPQVPDDPGQDDPEEPREPENKPKEDETCKRLRLQLEVDGNNLNAAEERYQAAIAEIKEIEAEIAAIREIINGAKNEVVTNAFPVVKGAKRLLQGKLPEPGDFAGAIPPIIDYAELRFQLADLREKVKQAREAQEFAFKDKEESLRVFNVTLAKIRKNGC